MSIVKKLRFELRDYKEGKSKFQFAEVNCGLIKMAADRIEHLENALNEMPEIDIAFNSKKDMDMWNGWKAEYFNSAGEIK